MQVLGWIVIGVLSVSQIALVILAIKMWKKQKGLSQKIDRNEFLK